MDILFFFLSFFIFYFIMWFQQHAVTTVWTLFILFTLQLTMFWKNIYIILSTYCFITVHVITFNLNPYMMESLLVKVFICQNAMDVIITENKYCSIYLYEYDLFHRYFLCLKLLIYSFIYFSLKIYLLILHYVTQV